MNCQRVRSLLSAYIDGELTGYEMLVVRDHISRCRECRDEHYSLKTIKYLLSALPEKQPNPEWATLLAESIARPTPSLAQRLRDHWMRSVEALATILERREGREASLVGSRQLLAALMVGAIGVFLVTSPFERPANRPPADYGDVTNRASMAPIPNPLPPAGYTTASYVKSPAPGVTRFIVIPLPPTSLAAGTRAAMPSQDWERAIRPQNMPGGMPSVAWRNDGQPAPGFPVLAGPWAQPRMVVSPVGSQPVDVEYSTIGPAR